VEAKILQQDDLAIASLVNSVLHLLAYTVVGERYARAQKLLEFGNDRLEAVLCVWLAVWSAEMAHEDNSFGSVVASMFDRGESADDALVVGDLLVGVEWDVEVDLNAT